MDLLCLREVLYPSKVIGRRWGSNPPAVWKQRSFAEHPGLLSNWKEWWGILSAPLLP